MSVPLSKQLNGKIDLKHLRHAVAAADYGSFRQAAEALNIKQSTLSRSILQLEHATSMRIFERSPGGVAVSHFGGEFIRMAKGVLEQINEFDLANAIVSRSEVLRIGFCTSLSAGGLRTNLLEFHGRFPEFRLELLERRRSQLSRQGCKMAR